MTALKLRPRHRLTGYLVGSWTIECHFCGEKHEFTFDESGGTPQEASEAIYRCGWREVSSNKYQVIAPACPECVRTKAWK